jgi:hypothetical protein
MASDSPHQGSAIICLCVVYKLDAQNIRGDTRCDQAWPVPCRAGRCGQCFDRLGLESVKVPPL